MKVITLSLLLILLFGCKTQEEIHREQLVDSMANQMRQGQNVSANITVEMSEVKKQILELQGMIEESGQQKHTSSESQLTEMTTRVNLIEEKNKSLQEQLDGQSKSLAAIKSTLNKQGKYLKTLLGTLKNFNGPATTKKSKKSSSKKKLSEYELAMKVYRNGQYAKAKPLFEKLANNSKIKGNQNARVLHNLGMTEYMLNNDQNALVYFSKLYANHPTVKYNANGLLFMAKAFQRLKRNSEAKATLNELMSKFPKSKKVQDAKKLLKML